MTTKDALPLPAAAPKPSLWERLPPLLLLLLLAPVLLPILLLAAIEFALTWRLWHREQPH